MTWLWSQWQDFALGLAAMFWAGVGWRVIRAYWENWRQQLAITCGLLAGLSAILAVSWAAHLGEKYGWLP